MKHIQLDDTYVIYMYNTFNSLVQIEFFLQLHWHTSFQTIQIFKSKWEIWWNYFTTIQIHMFNNFWKGDVTIFCRISNEISDKTVSIVLLWASDSSGNSFSKLSTISAIHSFQHSKTVLLLLIHAFL